MTARAGVLTLGAASLNQTALDWEGNKRNIISAIKEARTLGAAILCLPELCVCGYGCEDAFLGRWLSEYSLKVLREILPETRGIAVSVGLPVRYEEALYNTACLIVDGRIAGFAAKQFLAGEGVYYEPRWFKPWPRGQSAKVRVSGRELPFGDLLFDIGGVRVGFEICEDAWVAQRPGRELAKQRVDIILNPSASHFSFGKLEVRRKLVREGARDFGAAYAYSNLLGCESGRLIFDGGALIACAGKILAVGKRLTFVQVDLSVANIDLKTLRRDRRRSSVLGKAGSGPRLVRVRFTLPTSRNAASVPRSHALGWEKSSERKKEEFVRAVSLGLFDYLRKSRSHGFVVSLSGGADSSTVAVLVASMVKLAAAELGLADFVRSLDYIGALKGVGSEREAIGRLLTCIYQSTRNSSAVTRRAARELSAALGAEFMEFDVERQVAGYEAMVSREIGRQLSWERDDLARQNIQARARGPGAWLVANIRRALLLSTSNRSEAAVGYATMDGDTCGGLCPIAGVDKAFIREWLLWMQQTGPQRLGPIPKLSLVTAQEPTAELRPARRHQKDEDDLMPYKVLDSIERLAILKKQSPLEALRGLSKQYRGVYSRVRLRDWTDRFFRLWAANQWKRERYAPSFHLDDENLDPKTWCRFPILSGNFERELAELRKEG